MRKNAAAVALGRLAAGKKKQFSEETIEQLKKRLKLARKKRWQRKAKK